MKKAIRAFTAVNLITVMILMLTACGLQTFDLDSTTKNELIQPFNDNQFKKGESTKNQAGWSYRLRFFQDDKLTNTIVVHGDGSRISYKDYFYDTVFGVINTDTYKALLPDAIEIIEREGIEFDYFYRGFTPITEESDNEAFYSLLGARVILTEEDWRDFTQKFCPTAGSFSIPDFSYECLIADSSMYGSRASENSSKDILTRLARSLPPLNFLFSRSEGVGGEMNCRDILHYSI